MQMPLETVLGEEGYCIQHKERRLFFSGVNILTRTQDEIGYLAYRTGFPLINTTQYLYHTKRCNLGRL